jgi:hypothetical protein
MEGHGPLFYCNGIYYIVLFCSVYIKMAPYSFSVMQTDGQTDTRAYEKGMQTENKLVSEKIINIIDY